MNNFSKKRLTKARVESVDIRQMAVAELMAWGWDAEDAMFLVGLIKDTDTTLQVQRTAVAYTSEKNFDALYKKRVKQLRNGSVLDDKKKIHPTPGSPSSNKGRNRVDCTPGERPHWMGQLEAPASDEEILAAMWETIQKLEPKDPKRVDLLDKYDKLKRRQGVGEDDTTIHFYLPRPECDACPFRGGHVITEPEELLKAGIEPPKEPEPEPEPPMPGYFPSGKKIGRPPKKRRKNAKKTQEEPKEEL